MGDLPIAAPGFQVIDVAREAHGVFQSIQEFEDRFPFDDFDRVFEGVDFMHAVLEA